MAEGNPRPEAMADAARFDPRSLISGPFIACPRCGHEVFGVLIVSGNAYTRCCLDCRYKQELSLPTLRKKIIYLDQNVISNLMKLVTPTARAHEKIRSEPFWEELYTSLVQLRHLQLIVCPYSDSHENESLAFEHGAALRTIYQNLGFGISFDQFDRLKALQFAELGRAWSEGREPKFRFNSSDVLTREPNVWNQRSYMAEGPNPFVSTDELRRIRAETHASITNLFQTVWSAESHDFRYWYDRERLSYQGTLHKALIQSSQERNRAMLEFRPGEPIPLHNLNAMLTSFAENMVWSLNWTFRFPRDGSEKSPNEVAALEKSFGKANRIADAPFVQLSSLMFASIAIKVASGQRKPPNQGTMTDIETVSHLLPYCDAMFVDNSCRALLLDVPEYLRPSDTQKLFSLNVRADFLNYLRCIRDGISREQLDAVKSLYGERYTEGLVGVETGNAEKEQLSLHSEREQDEDDL